MDFKSDLFRVTLFLTLAKENKGSWYKVARIPVKTSNECVHKNNLRYRCRFLSYLILGACLLISAVNIVLSDFFWVVWIENTDLMSFESEYILFKFHKRSVDGT